MDSSRFALGVGLRALIAGALSFVAVDMVSRQLYAGALLLAGLAALAVLDIARHVGRADRILSRFVSAWRVGEFEAPAAGQGGIGGLAQVRAAMRRLDGDLRAQRAAQRIEVEYLLTLTDTVSAALLVIEGGEAIAPVNRAARKLVEAAPLDGDLAAQILALRPGGRAVIRLPTGQKVLAAAARFSTQGQVKTLVSLQDIQSELDATEIKAWQDLARILAHEMMNSLTPIASLAQSVRPLLADPNVAAMTDVAAAIDVIADRSAGLMSFVERYRQVADLPRPVFQPVKLAAVIAAVGQLLEPMLALKGVVYRSQVEPTDLVVWADPAMVEQALINLLRNAMDAVAGQPAPRVEVDCRREGEQVVITVGDNGAGVDPAVLDRIFVPFFTTKPGGSGVGLSLVRQIALAHGGQIEAVRGSSGGMLFRWRFAMDVGEPG